MQDDQQLKTPYLDKLIEYSKKDTVPFDVPGHKRGRMENDLAKVIGKEVFSFDSNAPRGLDNLNNPTGVIKEAEELMASAFHADEAYFLTGGTTLGVIAMIMATTQAKEKIILPRNIHKSVVNALILCGGIPIFIMPQMDKTLGIANGITFESVKETIDKNPDAKCLFIINPTYFGVACDIKKIIDYAHEHDIVVIADEAHGGCFYFSNELPMSAMDANADMSAVSIHKTLGSLTQSSILLTKGTRVDRQKLRATLNILQSTSPSQLLIASLDAARKEMYVSGEKGLKDLRRLANYGRALINEIPGLASYDSKYFIDKGCHAYDDTKLIIKVTDLGITGFEVYRLLATKYDIQMELAEQGLILAVLSIGNTERDILRLVDALKELSVTYHKKNKPLKITGYSVYPTYCKRPREAYHANQIEVKIEEALNEVAASSIMIYPPGIPLVIPGEKISKKIIDILSMYHNSDTTILSDAKKGYIRVVNKKRRSL